MLIWPVFALNASSRDRGSEVWLLSLRAEVNVPPSTMRVADLDHGVDLAVEHVRRSGGGDLLNQLTRRLVGRAESPVPSAAAAPIRSP